MTELGGKKIELLIPERFRTHHTSYRHSYQGHPEIRPMGAGRDLFARRKDGTEFPVEISLSPYRAGEKLLIIAFIIDISVRKEKEAADKRHHEQISEVNATIRKLNDALEQKVTDRTQQLEKTLQALKVSRDEISQSLKKEKELNDMKSRFVSMASHEFRTPLSTILSSASLLSRYTLTEEQPKRDKHVMRIKSAVNTLTGILQEFLSLGKMEDGMLRAHFTRFNLLELLTAVCAEMDEMKKSHQQLLYGHNGESMVRQDPDLLRNVFVNLLSNAIKFSPENGLVEIRSSVTEDDLIHISVRDEGIGIPEVDQDHLFERFFRSSNALHIQGTGLGLHIVGKYLELMDGTIRFNSKPGQGTEFFLTFKQPKPLGNTLSAQTPFS
jgi:signal transduction histidine kinase